MAITISNNTPSSGFIQWSGLHIQYQGVSYTITDGYTNAVYSYWTPTTPNALTVTNTFPTLAYNECMVFLNKSGTAVTVPTATVINGDLIVPQSIIANAIASNTITGDKLVADAITAREIASGTITASEIAVGTISANLMAVNSIGATAISANCITGDKLVADAITAREIASRTITANEIVAGTISAYEIASNTITANQIASGTITATQIASGTISANLIASNAIGAGAISANCITGDKLVADTITAREIAVGTITATEIAGGTITANKIATATITANEIASGTITTNNLASSVGSNLDISSNTSITLKADKSYVQSRGENLVTNGTGLLGNNTNFSAFTFDASDNYYCKGSFKDASYNSTRVSDEIIPVDVSKRYKMSVWAKANPYVGAHYFAGVICYDVEGNSIAPDHIMWLANTTTTLATDLKNGDTVVNLTSGANWNNATGVTWKRKLIFWNYVNGLGYAFPPNTYSRNITADDLWADGSISGNTITLRTPWSGGTKVAGTSLSQGSSGGTYRYITMDNVTIPNTWTNYTGTISGIDTSGTNDASKFCYGCTGIKLLFLNNRDTAGSTVWYSNLSFGIDTVNTDNVVSSINLTPESIKINASKVDITGAVTFSSLDTNMQNTLTNNNTKGLGMKVNYADFSTVNAGKLYLHGFDNTGIASDVNGFTMYNGTKVTVNKGMCNPNVQIPKGYLAVERSTGNVKFLQFQTNGTWKNYYDGSGTTYTPTTDNIFIGYGEMDGAENYTFALLWDSPMSLNDVTKLAIVGAWQHSSDQTKIDGGDVYAGSITADKLTANTITVSSGVISSGAITNAMIKDADITTAKIASATITGANIASATIDGANIKSATITNANITDTTIQSAKIANLDGTKIIANSLTADKIAVGNGDAVTGNLAVGKTYSGNNDNTVFVDGAKVVGSSYTSFGTGASNNNSAEGQYIQIDLGASYRLAESRIFFYSGDSRYYWYKVKYSTDGVTWYYAIGNLNNNGWVTSAPSTSGEPKYNPTVDTFGIPILARYIRLYANGNNVNTSNHIYEWELYSVPQTLINGGQIQTSTITADRLVANTITASSGIIADATITTAKIADANVTTAKIVDANITTAKIANLAVDSTKIANATITSAQIANATIDGANIKSATIDGANIKSATIDGANIKSATIATGNIIDANITTAKIADGNITNAKIANLAVDNAKISNLDATKITTGTIDANRISTNSLIVGGSTFGAKYGAWDSAESNANAYTQSVLKLTTIANDDILFPFSDNLCSTKGINPNSGYVATLRNNEGCFGSAIAIEEGSTNLLTNPTLSNSASGWNITNFNSLTPYAFVTEAGANKIRFTSTSDGDTLYGINQTVTGLSAGMVYTYSVYMDSTKAHIDNIISNIAHAMMYIQIVFMDASSVVLATNKITSYNRISDTSVRWIVSATSPANTTKAKIQCELDIPNLSNMSCSAIYNPMFEQKGFATSFVNGTRSAGSITYPVNINGDFTLSMRCKFSYEWYKVMTAYNKSLFTLKNSTTTTEIAFKDYTATLNTGSPFIDLSPDANWDSVMHHWHNTFSYTKDTWYYMNFIKSGNTWRFLFYDNTGTKVLDNTQTYSDSSKFANFTFNQLILNGEWCALFDELYLTKSILTEANIKSIYDAKIPLFDARPVIYVPKPSTVTLTVL